MEGIFLSLSVYAAALVPILFVLWVACFLIGLAWSKTRKAGLVNWLVKTGLLTLLFLDVISIFRFTWSAYVYRSLYINLDDFLAYSPFWWPTKAASDQMLMTIVNGTAIPVSSHTAHPKIVWLISVLAAYGTTFLIHRLLLQSKFAARRIILFLGVLMFMYAIYPMEFLICQKDVTSLIFAVPTLLIGFWLVTQATKLTARLFPAGQ